MTIQHFIFKYGRYATFGIFIIVLFLKYFAFPDFVAVNFDDMGQAIGFLPKSQTFYLLITLLLLVNIIFPFLTTVYKKWYKLNKNSNSIFSDENLENLVNLGIFLINIFMILALFILAKINSTEYVTNITQYVWFLYLLPILPASLVFYFLLKFKK